ncbi:hypothetical protein BH11GEM1_BH11GEM1_33520 [soil metagenome]
MNTPDEGTHAHDVTGNLLPGADGALAGGGEMGARVRAVDWSATPLGAVDVWPHSWRTAVSLCLSSSFPATIAWGEELTQIYNDAYIPVLGTKHPEALNHSFQECWAETWHVLGPMVRDAMTTGEASHHENKRMIINRYGYVEEAFFTYSFSPIRDDLGRIRGVFHPVQETTREVLSARRMRALRDLAARAGAGETPEEACAVAAETLAMHALDVPFVLAYLLDADGKHARLCGAAGLAAGARACPAVIDLAEASPADAWPLAEVMRSGQVAIVDDLEARFGQLPGGQWPESTQCALVLPIRQLSHDVPVGFLVAAVSPRRVLDDDYRGFYDLLVGHVSTAVSEALAFEAERRRAEALAELDRAKTAFFSNVSHEFRTPLTLMMNPLEELLATTNTTIEPGNRALIELAHRNSVRLLKLVNTLLDFSRAEAGRVTATYEPTDFSAFTAELASTFRSVVEKAGLKLVLRTPALAQPVHLDCDMWEKIVFNLLSNAFKHTFVGEIVVETRLHADHAEMEVRDTGIGIPDEQLGRVFERFHRVPSAQSRTHEGTGIGLALVQELVQRHGGRIEVQSVVGQGSSFLVIVPLGTDHLPRTQLLAARASADRAPAARNAAPFVAEASGWLPALALAARADAHDVISPARHPSRIVLADDNADMRNYVARLLEEQGWSVEAVSSGAAALAAVQDCRPDLVLSDIMMPGLDGFGLMRALREAPATRAIPIMLLSARAGEAARVEGAAAGAADYLVKPFSARELIARVRTQLDLRRMRLAAGAALRESEMRLRRVFEQAPAAVAVLRGPEHVFDIVNTAALEVWGATRTLVGLPIRQALPEIEPIGFTRLLDDVYRTGVPYVGTEVPVRIDSGGQGSSVERFFNLVYQPLHDAEERIEGILVFAVDVTTHVLARRALDVARVEAEAASHAKSDFLAMMSHELRTPLNAIQGYVQLLDMGIHGPVTEAQRETLARIARSQRHLLSLINDVLNLARIESGRVHYVIEDVVLQEAIAELGPMIEPQLAAKGLIYEVCLPDAPVTARADREKFRQIILNLLANAAKFTPGGGRVVVGVATREGVSDTVFVRVSDTGVGIARGKLEAIFEPFVQVPTGMTRTSDGAGLGLAISRDLARGMGGDLRARSVAGEGSTFTLSLPLLAGDTANDE